MIGLGICILIILIFLIFAVLSDRSKNRNLTRKQWKYAFPKDMFYQSGQTSNKEYFDEYLSSSTKCLTSIFPDAAMPYFTYSGVKNKLLLNSDNAYLLIWRTATVYSVWMMNAVKRKKVLKDAVREREIEKLTAYIGHKGTASWFSYFLSTVRNKGVLDIKSFLSEQNSTNAIICLEAVLSDAFGGNEGYTVGYWDHLVSMKPIRHLSKIIAYSEIIWKNTEWLDALHEDFSSERGRLAAQSAVIPGVKHWLEFFFEFRDSVCDFNELETCYNILCNLEKQLYSLMNAVYPSVSMEKPLSLNALPSSDFINLIETSDLYVRVIKCINEVINRIFERIASERTRKNSLSSYYIPARCFDIYERIRAYHPGIEAFVKYQQTSDNDMFKSGSTQFENKKRAMGFCHTDKVYDYREAFEKEYSRLRENRLVNTVSSYSPYRSSRRRVCDYDDVIRYAKNGLPLGVDDSLISDASFRSRSNRKYDLDNPEDLRAFDSDVYSLHKRIESEIEKKEKRRTEIEEFDEWLWYHR